MASYLKASSPPSTYELFGMNCTAFFVVACASGSITLPSALNGVAGISDPLNLVQTIVPAGLDNTMRAAKANGDTRVKLIKPLHHKVKELVINDQLLWKNK
jgi:hypothetical protein